MGRNGCIEKCARIPGHAARLREKEKFDDDKKSGDPVVSRGHRLVPFVVEDGGRLGQHALALLRELAERGVGRANSGHQRLGGCSAQHRWWATALDDGWRICRPSPT